MVDEPLPPPIGEDPPFVRRVGRRISQRAGAVRHSLRTISVGDAARRAGDFVLNPKIPKLQACMQCATRAGQWTSVVLLPFVIIISLAFVEALADVFSSLFLGVSGDIATSDGVTAIGFIITLMNLLLFIVASWIWFLWVRTAGFGFFNVFSME